jgi:hypothetical protein
MSLAIRLSITMKIAFFFKKTIFVILRKVCMYIFEALFSQKITYVVSLDRKVVGSSPARGSMLGGIQRPT